MNEHKQYMADLILGSSVGKSGRVTFFMRRNCPVYLTSDYAALEAEKDKLQAEVKELETLLTQANRKLAYSSYRAQEFGKLMGLVEFHCTQYGDRDMWTSDGLSRLVWTGIHDRHVITTNPLAWFHEMLDKVRKVGDAIPVDKDGA
jgi:hypothetical protein